MSGGLPARRETTHQVFSRAERDLSVPRPRRPSRLQQLEMLRIAAAEIEPRFWFSLISTMAGDLFSPPSPLGDSLLDSPLCGDLMADLHNISQSIEDDMLGFDFPVYQSTGSGSESSIALGDPSSVVCGAAPGPEESFSPLNLECRVCSDKASGFHYGVHACEGCKSSNGKVNPNTSTCPIAIRFGRMPQAEKLKLKAESKMVEKEVESPMLADHKILVGQIHEAYMKNFNMNKAKARLILTGKTSKPPFIIHDMETFQLAERTFAVHMLNDDCPEPESGLQAGAVIPAAGCRELQQREAEARLFHCCQSTSVETVTELTEFAKAVPGFQSLNLNDQVTLLKYGVYEALFTLLASCMNKDGLLVARGGGFITREFLKSLRRPFSDMMEPKFQFATRFNSLELNDSDLALFVAAIICCGDRPGLVEVPLVEQLQESIVQALQLHLLANHPDDTFLFPRLLQKLADLRELVTEHAQLVQEIETSEDTSLHPLLQEIYRDMY
ncbi:hypothetical protein FQN60_005581 [Etheostoma spectabile]|uniref:NR LBD domain-containing protein n=1 Tax=Etheostoma spectabile TaxID=54343 RepID=A0A5J5CHP1_9PERO|nr:hypothetical protein FQN60_005581 [Etheostoma spectabile]